MNIAETVAKYYAKRDILLDELATLGRISDRLIALKQIELINEMIKDTEELTI